MRLYSVALASLAADAPAKWTDNLLSHHEIPNVTCRERGVARGVSWSALVRVALIRELHLRLGCGVREAVGLAAALIDTPALVVDPAGTLSIAFDQPSFERMIQGRLREAMESAPRPRRGRPPRRLVDRG